MQSKVSHYFATSVAALLGALATGLILCNLADAKLLQPHEPLLAVRMSTLYWVLALGAMAVALACVYVRQARLKLALILWFAGTLAIYRLGLGWQGIPSLRGYLGSLAHAFNLSTTSVDVLLSLLFSYLLAGSAGLLLWNCLARPTRGVAKTVCAHCGGHIEFADRNVGQKVPCPHCGRETTLRQPGMLKIACYFCNKHIEFPAHALGTKIQCPHCKMDITLKEPAEAPGAAIAKAGK